MKLRSTLTSLAWVALVAALPRRSHAQAMSRDSLAYARARQMVAEGNGTAGRAIVDSALATIPANSARYAEGLFWRASIASSALDAERDYRRIAVEYSLSPRVPDALTRLAQLELARGDRMLAARHLERLLREFPPQPARAAAWFWLARVGFEDNDVARGCIALDSAQALASSGDAELVNQIRYESSRCLTRPASGAPITAPGATVTGKATPVTPATPGRSAAHRQVAGVPASFTVQVGAYPTRAAANRLRTRLARQGFAARVVPAGKLFRVRVGRFRTKADAERTATKLKAARVDAWIIDAEPTR
jgi:cell division septation protein DedD